MKTVELEQREFFKTLFEDTAGFIEIRALGLDHSIIQEFRVGCIEALRAVQEIPSGYNIHFGMCTRRDKRGKEEDVLHVPTLWAEVDAKHFEPRAEPDPKKNPAGFAPEALKRGKEKARRAIDAFEFQPSILVDSGGGYHLYWLLKEPEVIETPEDRLRVRGYLIGIQEAIHSDTVHDLARILRVPGTHNLKYASVLPEPPVVTVVYADADRRHNLMDFDDYFTEDTQGHKAIVTIGEIPKELPERFKELLKNDPPLKDTWEGDRPDLNDQTRSGYDMALAVQLEAERPPMIFAGNTALRSQIADIVGEQVELRAVDNVRPTLDTETLGPAQAELERIFREAVLSRLPGLDLLQRWSPGKVLPTAQGFGHVIRYLDRLNDHPRYGVLGIDVGGMTTTVAAARDGRFSLVVLTELGVGASIGGLLRQVPLEQVIRWLPEDVDPDRVRHLVMNKELRPWTVPQTEEDLLIEEAVAREVISLALAEARGGWPFRQHRGSPVVNEIIGSGSVLCHAPSPGHAALMLLDTVQPAFWTSRLVLDKTGALPALGALATVQPMAATQVLEHDGLLELGSVISPVGVARYGSKVLSFKVKSALGAYGGDVRFGFLERIIVPAGVKATLELRPTRRFDLGVGPGKGIRMEAWGGAVGVIIDARGRPLVWPGKKEERQAAVRQWLRELGAWVSLSDLFEPLGDL